MTRAALPFDPIAEARRRWEERGWVAAAPGMATVTSIMRAQQILIGRVDAELKPRGLTFSRYEVLMLLLFSRTGQLPMRVIGDRLQVHPTSVTNAVDRLQDDGLVERRPHPDDRRAVLVSITSLGRQRALEATDGLNSRVFTALGLGPADQHVLTGLVEQLRRNAGDF